MALEQERNYASIILRLLVDGTIDATEQQNVVWGDLLQISAQNGVLIRVVDQLETIGLEPRHFFSAAVKEMRARNQRKLALINHISERCTQSNIEFVFPKALQSYQTDCFQLINYPDEHSVLCRYLKQIAPNHVLSFGCIYRSVDEQSKNDRGVVAFLFDSH